MQISSIIPNLIPNNRFCSNPNKSKHTKLAPLACDTVSFGAMKKREFSGLDLAVVEKYNAPIEKFNTNEDLQNWAKRQIDEIFNKDFEGKKPDTQILRYEIIEDWSDYLEENHDSAVQYLILDSITKDLKPYEDKLPPSLNKKALNCTLQEIKQILDNNPKHQFDFKKIYQKNLMLMCYPKGSTVSKTGTGWIKIPSFEHDKENFEDNIEKLTALSCDTWCTKSIGAKYHLQDGDFYVYIENHKPKAAISLEGDRIREIQGELNNSEVPEDYKEIIDKCIEANNLIF